MIHALCYFAEKRMLLAFKLAQGLRKSKSLFVQEAVVCTIQHKIPGIMFAMLVERAKY